VIIVMSWDDRSHLAHGAAPHKMAMGSTGDVLLGLGRQFSAFAADDAHFQPQDPPGCVAWVQVRAETLDPAELLAALKAGRYYASTGG
jgi:hypothetical protein